MSNTKRNQETLKQRAKGASCSRAALFNRDSPVDSFTNSPICSRRLRFHHETFMCIKREPAAVRLISFVRSTIDRSQLEILKPVDQQNRSHNLGHLNQRAFETRQPRKTCRRELLQTFGRLASSLFACSRQNKKSNYFFESKLSKDAEQIFVHCRKYKIGSVLQDAVAFGYIRLPNSPLLVYTEFI